MLVNFSYVHGNSVYKTMVDKYSTILDSAMFYFNLKKDSNFTNYFSDLKNCENDRNAYVCFISSVNSMASTTLLWNRPQDRSIGFKYYSDCSYNTKFIKSYYDKNEIIYQF